MGRQSSRLIYRGQDIKDIVYQGNFLNKLYKGNDLVWEKLYRYFFWMGNGKIFDLDSKKIIENFGSKYLIGSGKCNTSNGICFVRDKETNELFFAITEDYLAWKRIEGIDFLKYQVDYGFYGNYFISSTDDGFFIYFSGSLLENKKKNELYLVTIDSGLEYEVKKIYSSDIWFRYPQLYGISDSFYGIQWDRASEYILYRIKKDGTVSSQRMLGNFEKDNVTMGNIHVLANGNGDIYFICYDAGASNGGTYIFHASGLSNADYTTISFSARNSRFLEGYLCGIDIVYDSYQTLFVAHNASNTVGNITRVDAESYRKMEFYTIDAVGNTLRTLQKDGEEDMYIRCIGLDGIKFLAIKFEGRETGELGRVEREESIYYRNITKGISSSVTGDTSLEINYDKARNDRCFIGSYSFRDNSGQYKKMIIYIDNLFLRESENNFAVVIE